MPHAAPAVCALRIVCISTGGRVVEWGGELISTVHTRLRNLAHQLNLELEDADKWLLGEEEVHLIDGVLRSETDLLAEWLGGLYELVKWAQQEAPWHPFYNAYTEAHHSRGAFISPDIGAMTSWWGAQLEREGLNRVRGPYSPEIGSRAN